MPYLGPIVARDLAGLTITISPYLSILGLWTSQEAVKAVLAAMAHSKGVARSDELW